MMQSERRQFLLEQLLVLKASNPTLKTDIQIPKNMGLQRQLLRTLMNEFAISQLSKQFEIVHNDYLSTLIAENGITDVNQLIALKQDLFLWKGDLTTLKCDAVVCPADSKLKGLLYPQKNKIDNSIHAFAGMRLKEDCDKLLNTFDKQLPMGQSVMTSAYNLPSKWILHTLCPVIKKQLSDQDAIDFASCHKNCLILATHHRLKHVAFGLLDCIEHRSAKIKLARIAINTIMHYKKTTNSPIKVVLCASNESDYEIFYQILSTI